ncbi:aromatic ring hydroxylating dioxygenase, beta subunit [Pseudomonas chlororaphis subsp. aurantiaca]|uniref:aromatic-ring-hydroxylating dioxygenase subunit beta n=1 Tax=Pseudomonas chlororaphis TaxID=587753 RepID=UPI000864F2E8|nr:aromatic-ring-hydroxylating dioxygenase subunit beta [Pseudomonas chlororaphis]BAV73546.1 aromatic ring hydroxylating dioxygenase, beta subunit [Pseudomonas chlororaphis subsp. aurantiaca]
MDNSPLEQLIYQEIALLDQQDFAAWQQLLCDDFHYWIPLRHDQPCPLRESSLLYEDRFLTTLRINRLASARNFSQQPKSRSLHIAQRPTISLDPDGLSARCLTPMLYCEARGDSEWHYPVTVEHQLLCLAGQWKIQRKKVLLLNPSRAFESLQLII